MDFNGINLPDLTPRIDTSFIDEMNRRNQEMIDSITSLNEILAEEIKPILEGNQKVVEGLNDNYSKLNDLYLLKEKELEEGNGGESQRTVVPHEVGEIFFRLRDDSFLPPAGYGNSLSGAECPRCFKGGGAGHPVLRAFCAQSARESRDSLRRSAAREFQRERHVLYGKFPEVAGHIVINLIAGRKETHMSRCPVGELIGMTASGSLTLRITHGHAGCIPFFRDGIRSVFPVELRGKHLKAIMAERHRFRGSSRDRCGKCRG